LFGLDDGVKRLAASQLDVGVTPIVSTLLKGDAQVKNVDRSTGNFLDE
jgi:hypothetical protein